MFCKILTFGALVVATYANYYEYDNSQNLDHQYEGQHHDYHGHATSSQNLQQHHHDQLHHQKHNDFYSNPKYHYDYSIGDPHTGDHKSQHEYRDGDTVHGFYTLLQPDGSVRKVEYSASAHGGFHAKVQYTAPLHHHQNDHIQDQPVY